MLSQALVQTEMAGLIGHEVAEELVTLSGTLAVICHGDERPLERSVSGRNGAVGQARATAVPPRLIGSAVMSPASRDLNLCEGLRRHSASVVRHRSWCSSAGAFTSQRIAPPRRQSSHATIVLRFSPHRWGHLAAPDAIEH